MFSSNLFGKKKNIDVMNKKDTEIHPIGTENTPRLKSLFLNVFLETVNLNKIGIAYDI
jgi:hypothetical protein